MMFTCMMFNKGDQPGVSGRNTLPLPSTPGPGALRKNGFWAPLGVTLDAPWVALDAFLVHLGSPWSFFCPPGVALDSIFQFWDDFGSLFDIMFDDCLQRCCMLFSSMDFPSDFKDLSWIVDVRIHANSRFYCRRVTQIKVFQVVVYP